MNTLWTFGDSFTESFIKKSKYNDWKLDYINWKGYCPKVYGEIISDKLKLHYINLAKSGTNNYTIFDNIISSLEKIQKDDIIIIGWSNTLRFRVATNINTFSTIKPGCLDDILSKNSQAKYIDLSNNTLKEMCINRDNIIFINELNNYIKLLNFTFNNNKIIHWSPFAQDRQGLSTTLKTLRKYESINDETNGVINDNHFSENAHKILSEELINIINGYDFSKLHNIKSFNLI
jgi:hypothetical protein